MRHTFRHADRILVTRDTLALVPRHWHYKCEIQLAIGLSNTYLSNARSLEKRAAHAPTLLFVGRLLEWKGLAVALKAVSAIHQSFPGLRFVIAGDGPARTRLEKLSRQLGLADIVEWAGWRTQPQLEQHYRAADLLLFPSMRDSGGMAVLEALAHGLPVLCTDLGGPGHIVNETCGRAVPTHGLNQEQLAGKFSHTLREFLDAPDRMHSLSNWASARAQQFDFRNLARLVHPPPAARSRARQI